eukprot:gb/GFBE01019267.1/.p1 GENE.gb/GFBE01019267.1/~~gb/GFBE01019267.1/.p1  ORF type:complete len:564 (+),score=95.14 gb/GFBE01019267.1/:1-1692(+)
MGDIADSGKPVSETFLGDGLRFFQKLRQVFGQRFLFFLGLNYFGLKGIALALITSAMLPYFQSMQVSGTVFQLAQVVAMIPWSMKGWIGVLSDVAPLGRYHKRGYMLLSAFVGIVGLVLLGLMPLSATGPSSVWPVACMFCCANIFLSTFDLLCEGKYSELMREESAGSEVLSFVWGSLQLGSLLAAVLIGTFIDGHGPQPMLIACLPLAALAAWRTAAGDLPEQPHRSRASLWLKATSEPELFLLATAMAAGSLMLALSAGLLGRFGRSAVALGVSGCLVLYSFRTLPRTLARANLYLFIISVSYLDVSGPLAYFYTGKPSCILDAPHFSYSYYLAVSNAVGSGGAAVGAVVFQYLQDWTFRSAFCITTMLQVVASFFDLLIISRGNIALGLSDSAVYLFGDAACQSMAKQMAIMPMSLLTARLCPRGAEATVFAILAGFQNFGFAVGSVLGVELSEAFEVQASMDGPCDFEWLPVVIVIGHMIAPMACLPLTWCLVPDARMDDEAAFELMSPPPSFCSPAASPTASPRVSPEDPPPPDEGDTEYCLMEDNEGTMARQFSAT